MTQQATNPPSPRNRLFGYIQLILIVGAIAVALILARAPDPIERDTGVDHPVELPPPAVNVLEQPQTTDFTLPLKLTGNVTLEERITIGSEAQGRIVWVSEKFRAGETIAANEVFVRIDPAEYRLRVQEAEARLRIHRLKFESQSEKRSFGDRRKQVARSELFETWLDLAKLKLAQTEISLPYDFRVIRADVEVGELAGPFEQVGKDASILGVGYRPEAVQASAPMDPKWLETLQPVTGRPAQIVVGNQAYRAKLERVSSVVSRESRLIRVFFRFADDPAADPLPLPGMFATIHLQGQTYEGAFALPHGTRQSGETAWVVDNGVVKARTPKVLGLTDEFWMVEPFDIADGIVVGDFPTLAVGAAVVASPLN